MALGKMLKLGGMENSPPKTSQSLGRFRVARNVLPTPDGSIIPRSEIAEIPDQVEDLKYIHYYTQYGSKMLSVASQDIGGSSYRNMLFSDNTRVPSHIEALGFSPVELLDRDSSSNIMSFRKNNTVYIQNPHQGILAKYDGIEVSEAGSHQPIISCAQYASAGTKFIRVIQHSIDFDNNEPVSEYVQFPTSAASSITLRVDGGATNIIPNTNVLPGSVVPRRLNQESPYFRGSMAYVGVEQHYTVTASETNINQDFMIGSYVIIQGMFTPPSVSNLSENVLAIALKIKSHSPLILDANDGAYLTLNREWKFDTIASSTLAASTSYGTRTFLSIWASSNANGNFVFRGYGPSFPYSSTSYTFSVDVTNVGLATGSVFDQYAFSISSNLGDWYDVNTRKLSPNAEYPFGITSQFQGISSYQDQIIMWTDDLIWYSDPTLGGSVEQLNTSSFFRVGDFEFGQVMSCCGTEDFFFISRERKNYFLSGNLSTGNYRVQEIPEAEIGAWSNNCTINIKDSVVMITALGVFQIQGGGSTTKLSGRINKNFSRYNGFNVNEDISFSLTGTNILEVGAFDDVGLSVAYDEYRELLVFMRKGASFASNPCLVLHTATGEFYEWDGFISDSGAFCGAIGFKDAKLYVGKFFSSPLILEAKTLKEDVNLPLTYPSSNPIKLLSSWLTGGEPSLEKELLQLKIFGRIYSDGTTSSIKVTHYRDWDISTKITNKEYFPSSSQQFSNKQRLNSDKVLAASCGLEVDTENVTFEIESLEVEFNPIQQGIKR